MAYRSVFYSMTRSYCCLFTLKFLTFLALIFIAFALIFLSIQLSVCSHNIDVSDIGPEVITFKPFILHVQRQFVELRRLYQSISFAVEFIQLSGFDCYTIDKGVNLMQNVSIFSSSLEGVICNKRLVKLLHSMRICKLRDNQYTQQLPCLSNSLG